MARTHFIEFRETATLNLENGGVTTTCQVERGVQCQANVRCFVICRNDRYLEVANVSVKEGLLRCIPCACFMFIDVMD